MSLTWQLRWVPLILLPIVTLWAVPTAWPRWALMWLISLAIFAGCKWLAWHGAQAATAPRRLHLGYLFAWPGMDADAFLSGRRCAPPETSEWALATVKFAVGLALLFGVARLVSHERPHFAAWIGMVGLVMVLHFGGFHLLSCAWRRRGVNAQPLMNWPLCSASLGEFWGRRWNTAFRDLAHRFVFRPLSSRVGPRRAMFAGFAVSGLIHDAVISIPAGGGYGGPTLFFALQGVAQLVERSAAGRRIGLGCGWAGRLFTAAVLLLPACLLFHPPFIRDVVLPFLRSLGAI